MRFAVKHAVAGAVVVGGVVALTAASYFALLAWAVLMGEPLGGPLAFPFLVLFALAVSIVSAVMILLPTTAFTEWISAKRGFRLALQIPIATACLGGYILSAAFLIALLWGTPLGQTARAAAVVFASLLVPLGLYWWSLQSVDWVLRVGTRWWSGIGGGGVGPGMG